ncbi:MAG: DNA primase [Gaiellales bacterium]
MALIRDTSIEAVRAAADIVEIVGSRVQLRRVGSRFVGRCPFHDERTPSFSVSPERGTYYCFGCQKGGDVFSFVRETEGLDFVEAVETLAERYRVTLEYEQGAGRSAGDRERRERLLSLLEDAARYYERYLWDSPAGEPVRAYLAGRGLREETCRAFRLGLSPGGEVLPRKAREKGYAPDELAAAGLVNRRGNDAFGARLIFPLADARGRVLGFGARRLRDDDPLRGKYVNTQETELFQKSAIVYGLDRARATIAKDDRALVVEGYTDVLALHQAGLTTAVAAMGTALTERQLRELRRLCSRLFLCFDADKAGETATLRGMELAYRQFDEVRIVLLPQGTDPADAAEGFAERLERAESYPRHRVKLEIDRAPSREVAFQRLREVMASFDQNTEWMEAVEYAADRLDLPRDLQAALAPRASRSTGAVSRKALEARDRLERGVLAGVLAHRDLVRILAEITPEHFESELHRRMRSRLVGQNGAADEELARFEAELDALATAEAIDERAARELLLRLRERFLRKKLAGAALAQTKELQQALERVHAALHELT